MYFTQKQMWKREDDEVASLPAGSTRRTVKSEQQHLSPHAHIRDSTETAYFTSSPSSSLSSSTVHSTFPEPRTFPPEFSPPSSRLVRHGFIRFRSGSRASSLFFFFFEGKQVECFTENEHHPQVESLSPRPVVSGTAFRRPASTTTPPTGGRGQNGKRRPRRRKGRRPVTPACRSRTYSGHQ